MLRTPFQFLAFECVPHIPLVPTGTGCVLLMENSKGEAFKEDKQKSQLTQAAAPSPPINILVNTFNQLLACPCPSP